jgi:hypothetical protein
MTSEFEMQITARIHQDELLEEAATRRLLRTSEHRDEFDRPVNIRIKTLLRRLAGAPTFA